MSEEKKYSRPSWDDYFMKIAMLVSERSTCLRHRIGAIVVKDKRILTTGYNGAARGVKDCLQLGYCLKDKQDVVSGAGHEVCPAIHAEQNAIIQAGRFGIDISDAIIYCTHTPCIICARMVVNAGVKKFFTYTDYPDTGGVAELFKETGVEMVKMNRPKTEINYLD